MGCTGSKLVDKQDTELDDLAGRVFIMVNSSSGGNAGKALLEMDTKSFEFPGKIGPIRVWLYNMRDNEERAAGFAKIKQEHKRKAGGILRVIAAGGDGTVMWVLSELRSIKATSIPISVIPLGTGNDFSRAYAWGSSPPKPMVGQDKWALKKRVEEVLDAPYGPHDLWNVKLQLRKNGKFFQVKGSEEVETHKDTKTLELDSINYVSFGGDAQIVFEFEKNRTTTQLGNKWVYVKKGVTQVVNRPKKLRKMVKSLTDADGKENIKYRKGDRVMAFINIPSYSSGARIWRPSKSRKHPWDPQYVGDKRIECLTVATVTDVAAHIASGGNSFVGIRRTAQRGNYKIEFQEKCKVYVQVDGEPLLCEDLESLTIQHGVQVQVVRSKKAIAKPFADGTPVPMDNILATSTLSDIEEEEEIVEESDGEDDDDEEDQPEMEEEPTVAEEFSKIEKYQSNVQPEEEEQVVA